MIRYEANIDGTVEVAEPFTGYDELHLFKQILEDLNWMPKLLFQGRGGYYKFEVFIDERKLLFHVYLKKLTFGGRENRPYEKRAQFSAAIDRTGFERSEEASELSLILALYKREEVEDTIICAWDINDWGHNIGRAFNCFIEIKTIAAALKSGFAQHETSIGQIACCFKPDWFRFYIENKDALHGSLVQDETLISKQPIVVQTTSKSNIPGFEELFQLTLDILRQNDGVATVEEIEAKAADFLNLSEEDRQAIHNPNEGFRTELGYRLAWARYYLKRANLVSNPKRSIWSLTPLGIDTRKVNKGEIVSIATEREISQDVIAGFHNNIKTDESSNEIEFELSDSQEIEHPFDPNKVDIKTKSMSLDLILKRLDREEIDLSTSFQRKAGLWDATKQSRLIESILIKFPLPAFYFDGSNDDKWLVVDGLQRLSSLDNFVNKKTLVLQNLEFLEQFNGRRFYELPSNLQRRIEEFETTAYIIAPGTPKELKYIVFRRINTGGLILTAQEIRNALNQGVPSEYVKKLASLRSFKETTSFSIPEDRMLDREFVTRFLAFYLNSYENYKPDLDRLLNATMEEIDSLSYVELERISDRFDIAMTTAFKIFGDDAFRKRYSEEDKRKPINKALFEVWSVLLSRLGINEQDLLVQRKNQLRNSFINLLNDDEEFNEAITSGTGDKLKVKKRFVEIYKLIQSVLSY